MPGFAGGGETTGFALEDITAVRKGLGPMILPASSCRQHRGWAEQNYGNMVGMAARGAHGFPVDPKEKEIEQLNDELMGKKSG